MPNYLYNRDDLMTLATRLVDKIVEEEGLAVEEGDERLDKIAERVISDYIEGSTRFPLTLTVAEAHEAMGEAIRYEEAHRGRTVGVRVEGA